MMIYLLVPLLFAVWAFWLISQGTGIILSPIMGP